MDDSYKQKLDFLSKDRDSVHVYHAYKWIQANDSKFQKKVYGPLYLEVNVPNPLHARFLEHVCPKWLLHVFKIFEKFSKYFFFFDLIGFYLSNS